MRKDIIGKLELQVENYKYFQITNKYCDKCRFSYPEAMTLCYSCGGNLRAYKLHNNLHELL